MNTIEIDCRNLECPAPVLRTRAAAEDITNLRIRVLVDNEAAIENVSRFLSVQNFQVSVDSMMDFSVVEGIRQDTPETEAMKTIQEDTNILPKESARQGQQKRPHTMILISSDCLGKGDDELGKKLMENCIKTLPEMGGLLWRMAFVNGGVKLTTKGSPLLEDLILLEQSGVDILVCGACLTHFHLLEDRAVGTTTNMLDIVTSMQIAQKIITL